jgi:RIO kinase 1
MVQNAAMAVVVVPGQFDDPDDDEFDDDTTNHPATNGAGEGEAKLGADVSRHPLHLTTANEGRQHRSSNLGKVCDNDINEYIDDDDYYYDEDELAFVVSNNTRVFSSNPTGTSSNKMNFSHSVANSVAKMHDMETHKRTLTQGRDDRATSEQVLDPRTRLILFKLLSRGFLELIDGCLSTGKEANVYFAKAGQLAKQQQQQSRSSNTTCAIESDSSSSTTTNSTITEYAIKIYKTSILVFRDRDKYVSGEHRWRRGYCKSNPRKMVKVWAEKELRNYRRIHQAGIPCPTPILLKSHVLVMEFLGTDGWPAPRLKDTNLSERRLRQAYVQCVMIMRHMYQRCRLVHGDLSEYNVLWHKQQIYVIDVSQSVETDHPAALDFLRKDAATINDYFQKVARLTVMTTRQLFDFVTDSPVVGADDDDYTQQLAADHASLDAIMEEIEATTAQMGQQSKQDRREREQREEVDEAVFMSSFLPRSLNQVAEHELPSSHGGNNNDVEETYFSLAVASMTGHKNGVAPIAAAGVAVDKRSRSDRTTKSGLIPMSEMAVPPDPTVAVDEEKEERFAERKQTKVVHFAPSPSLVECDTTNCIRISADSLQQEQSPEEHAPQQEYGEDALSDSDCSSQSLSSSYESETGFGRRTARSPQVLQAERETRRAERKANKKATKETQSEKRQAKIKKKDKRRAIKKTKAGNRKTK